MSLGRTFAKRDLSPPQKHAVSLRKDCHGREGGVGKEGGREVPVNKGAIPFLLLDAHEHLLGLEREPAQGEIPLLERGSAFDNLERKEARKRGRR